MSEGDPRDRGVVDFVRVHDIQVLSARAEVAGGGPLLSARGFALIMIVTGLVALLLAAVQHRESMQMLRQLHGPQPRSVSGAVGWLIAPLGVFALIGVIAGM